MILLDLALQGFRDLAGSVRVRLQSGYNALVAPTVTPETLVEGFLLLLFSSGDLPELKGSGKSGGGVRLAVEAGAAAWGIWGGIGGGVACGVTGGRTIPERDVIPALA